MTFKVEVDLRGRVSEATAAEIQAGKRAVTGVLGRRTIRIKEEMRRQLRAAGLSRGTGRDLAKALRGESYPQRGASLNAKGVVFSVARYKNRAGGAVDLITVFEEGAAIRPVGRKYLAIPTEAAGLAQGPGRGGPRKASPADFPAGTFAFIPERRGGGRSSPARLVFKAQPEVTAFILVRDVRIRRRLALVSVFERLTADLDQEIAREWDSLSRSPVP